MTADDAPLKPQCEDALHEIYHLLAGELDDHKRARISEHLKPSRQAKKQISWHYSSRSN